MKDLSRFCNGLLLLCGTDVRHEITVSKSVARTRTLAINAQEISCMHLAAMVNQNSNSTVVLTKPYQKQMTSWFTERFTERYVGQVE